MKEIIASILGESKPSLTQVKQVINFLALQVSSSVDADDEREADASRWDTRSINLLKAAWDDFGGFTSVSRPHLEDEHEPFD